MNATRLHAYLLLLGLFFSGYANSHHSVGAHFDRSKTVSVRGVVVEFKLMSPHATMIIDGSPATDEGPQNSDVERWAIASISAPGLRTLGIDSDTFQPGDAITIIGHPHRNPEFRSVFSNWFIASDNRVFRNAISPGQRLPPSASASALGPNRLEGRWKASLSPLPEGSPLPLNELGMSAWRNFDPKLSPANTCEPVSIPGVFLGPYLFDIDISEHEITLHNQFYDIVRKMPRDGKAATADPAGIFGTIRGRLDGDTLIVESRNYPPSKWGLAAATTVLGGGSDVPSSEKKSVTERYTVSENGRTLTIDYTIRDPVYLSTPYAGHVELARITDDTPMYEYECDLESAAQFSREPDEELLRVGEE